MDIAPGHGEPGEDGAAPGGSSYQAYYLALAKLADVVLPPHRAAADDGASAEGAPLAAEKATVG